MRDTTEEIDLRAAARAAFAKAETEEIALPSPGAQAVAPRGAARWELGEPLARGTFGVVHEARDRTSGGKAAVKVLRPSSGPEAVARFAREAEAARRLDHPGIARVLDSGVADGMPFIAFELVRGKTLEETILEEGILGENAALGLVTDLARALAHAHERGVLHRDVSPANVLVSERGPVLIDFGLAKDLLAAEALTRTGDVLGTLRFMAPESLAGHARRADERADVFGLGAVLHFALSGSAPFSGGSAVELAREMERTPPPPEGASPRVRAILARLLAPRPEERVGSAKAVLELLEGRAVAPPTPVAKGSPRRRVRPWIALAVTCGVLVLGGVAIFHLWQRARALAIVDAASAQEPIAQQAAAERALGIVPGLEEAFALRSLARMRLGDLGAAETDLARAGCGPLARRARGWVLFRTGMTEEGLALLAGTPDAEYLSFFARKGPAPRSLEGLPRFAAERALLGGDPVEARRLIAQSLNARTVEGADADIFAARLEAALFDEQAAMQLLGPLRRAPPREDALGMALEKKLARAARGESVGEDAVDAALAFEAREEARVLLAAHELTARESDLALATRRLRTAVALGANDPAALGLLVRALARRPRHNEAELHRLAARAGGPEAARGFLVLGDVESARTALAGASDPLARDVAALLARDGEAALRRFVPEGGDPHDGEIALKVLERLVRGEPTGALTELEYLEKGRSTIELARARVNQDPVGSLVCLVRSRVVSGEAFVLADALAESLQESALKGALAARGMSADEVARGVALVGPERAQIFELTPPPSTFEELKTITEERGLDAILLHRDRGLVRFRADPRWAGLLGSR